MSNLLVRGDKKPKRSWSTENDPEYYYGKVEQIFSQLELIVHIISFKFK